MRRCRGVDVDDAALVDAAIQGDTAAFEALVRKYQPRVFATVRRYSRRDSEVEDIAQDIFIKVYQKLATYRKDAPFEHWLMRLAVRTCYDALRAHRRNRETNFSDMTETEVDWLERYRTDPESAPEDAEAARLLVQRVLDQLTPGAKMIITLLEIEEKSVKEIAALTGWSVPLVKVRAFRARAEMRKVLAKLTRTKYM